MYATHWVLIFLEYSLCGDLLVKDRASRAAALVVSNLTFIIISIIARAVKLKKKYYWGKSFGDKIKVH